MPHNILGRLRKIGGSICLSVAVLVIANSELILQQYRAEKQPEANEFLAGHRAHIKLTAPSTYKPLQSALSQSLEQDELKDENPFAHLSNLDPLQEIMHKGVAKFRRETYRSPDYQDESGYDLISYEIEQTDGSTSTILAYLEKPEPTVWRNVGAPDLRVPFVIFMVSANDGAQFSSYRGGELLEQSHMSGEQAEKLVADRLSQGLPFLSVSR